jgi:hypothetical protein
MKLGRIPKNPVMRMGETFQILGTASFYGGT